MSGVDQVLGLGSKRNSNASDRSDGHLLGILASPDGKNRRLPDSTTASSSLPVVKRARSEMDNTGMGEHAEDIDMDSVESSNIRESDATTSRTSLTSDHSHIRQRSESVDMIESHPIDTSKPDFQGQKAASGQPAADLPPIDEQVERVLTLIKQPMVEDVAVYIVSTKWLNRAISRSSHANQGGKIEKSAVEGEIGPVDSSDIATHGDALTRGLCYETGQPFVPLKEGLVEKEDYHYLPQEAWDLITHWYGLAHLSPVIVRFPRKSPSGQSDLFLEPTVELNPPIFIIRKLRNDTNITVSSLGERNKLAVRLLSSIHETCHHFLSRAKDAAGIDRETKVRTWFVDESQRDGTSGMGTPAASRSASPAPRAQLMDDAEKKLIVDMNEFLVLKVPLQREALEAKDTTISGKTDDHSSVSDKGLTKTGTYVLEEQIGGPGGGEWPVDAAARNFERIGLNAGSNNKLALPKSAANNSALLSPGGVMTRGRTQRSGRVIGKVGLTNLGNTCYMNSAIQCLRNTEELTRYILSKQYMREINTDNILGYHGEVAEAYAGLVLSMYKPDVNSSNSPRHLKSVVGRHNSLFQSFGQQDSQEFVGFMLDGLNEDLNRIEKKPTVETPDSTDEHVNNPVALRKLADQCWAGYKARNDSVIVDLFAGAYKSTLVCPVCDKVSITFDPFTSLTLQLPLDNMWSKEVYFWPLSGPLIKLYVDLDKSSTIRQLKEFVAKRMQVDPRLLQVSEIFKSKFYRHYVDLECASEQIAENDDIIVYELESTFTNIPASRNPGLNISDTPEWDSPLADRLLVPVFLRKPEDTRNPRECFSLPFFIILTPSEARDYNTILKKILQKLDTLTTRDLFENVLVEPSSNHSDDHEMVSAIDDSDSSVTSKIKTTSIDGEDGLVDVSMKESKSAGTKDHVSLTSESPQGPKSTASSKIRLSGSIIPDELYHLFELRYFKTDAELLPNQWRSMTRHDRTDCPLVESRGNQIPSEPSSIVLSDEYVTPGDDESTDEQNDVPGSIGTNAYVKAYQAKQTDDSDDEDEGNQPGIQQIKNGSFKRKLTPQASPTKNPSDPALPLVTDEPLVRLLEGLILDFEPEVEDTLFGATVDSDDERGAPTWESIETFQDPELEKRRSTEANRRKQGITLEDCLDEFEREEILSENDMWYCSRCKEHRRASKKFELWQSPDILVIHLKRFSAGIRGFRDKIEVMVDFPVEGLDLTKRVADKATGKEYIYDLYAVDNHFGGLGGGHYTAYAKNFINNVWYEYNDSSVHEKSNPQKVVTKAAYLLFYRRRSDHPLGGPFLEKIVDDANRVDESDEDSQQGSRNGSPFASGEGRRLDDFSLNGSSSASRGVEAVHPGGLGTTGGAAAATNSEGDLPAYSQDAANGETRLFDDDNVMHDEGFGVQSTEMSGYPGLVGDPGWNWEGIQNKNQRNRANSPDSGSGDAASNFSNRSERMGDFEDDIEDEALGMSPSSQPRNASDPDLATKISHGLPNSIPMDVQTSSMREDEDDPVTEIYVEKDEGLH